MAEIRQVETRKVKLTFVMSRAAFVKGFQDVKKGRPFDYDIEAESQWSYERGRLLATVYDGPLKEGRYVTPEAQRAYKDARAENLIL